MNREEGACELAVPYDNARQERSTFLQIKRICRIEVNTVDRLMAIAIAIAVS